MDDAELVDTVAADYVRQNGAAAPAYLRDFEFIARGRGDELSADAWEDIANAATAILEALKDAQEA
jgi:hypothetical protein